MLFGEVDSAGNCPINSQPAKLDGGHRGESAGNCIEHAEVDFPRTGDDIDWFPIFGLKFRFE